MNQPRPWIRWPLVISSIASMGLTQTDPSEPVPVAVSPGSSRTVVEIGSPCPTFSWGMAEGQVAELEIAVFRIAEDDVPDEAPVWVQRLPGAARSWTPALVQCLDPGALYGWAVRGVRGGSPGDWSSVRLFSVATTTSKDPRTAGRERRRAGTAKGHETDTTRLSLGDASFRMPRIERDSPLGNDSGSRTAMSSMDADAAIRSTTVGLATAPLLPPPASYSLSVTGDVAMGGNLFKGGAPFLHDLGGATYRNTAVGRLALANVEPAPIAGRDNSGFGYRSLYTNVNGAYNTAIGVRAMEDNVNGALNVAVGWGALAANISGSDNTAVGVQALRENTVGELNVGLGVGALSSNTQGTSNVAAGASTLQSNSTGSHNVAVGHRALNDGLGNDNTAVGDEALSFLVTGNNNTALGAGAGVDLTEGFANIFVGVGAAGNSSETGVIRIGGDGNQSKTFIEGIFGATATGGSQVFINSSNQLGTATSSARFKQDIVGLTGFSDRLLALRPVSFRYKEELLDLPEGADNPIEFGLIAEEVAEEFPELVIDDEDGRPYTVRYHQLAPLLLAEIQRQQNEIAELRRAMAENDRQMAERDRRMTEQDRRMAALEHRLEKLTRKKRL